MLRTLAMTTLSLLISTQAFAVSVGSHDALIIDGELVKSDGQLKKTKAWGESTVEVRTEGKAKIVAVSDEASEVNSVSPHSEDKAVAQHRFDVGQVK